MAAFVGEYCPAKQSSQAVAPVEAWKVPLRHSEQLAVPLPAVIFPAGQFKHALDCASEYWPALQNAHTIVPDEAEYCPPTQSVHDEDPVEMANVPTAQDEQTVWRDED